MRRKVAEYDRGGRGRRRPNGSTLVNKTDPPVAALEFTPGRKILWAPRSRNDPAMTIQLPDSARVRQAERSQPPDTH
jgi:hypothetical protein